MEKEMEDMLVVKIADNIISPLGYDSESNFKALLSGESALTEYKNEMGILEPFTASMFKRQEIEKLFKPFVAKELYTYFEKLAIVSISKALQKTDIDVSSNRVMIIVSSTKGNIDLLDTNNSTFDKERVLLGVSAKKIAEYFNNKNTPIVISNACISGVNAQIEAMRILNTKKYDYVVVVGVDVLSKFIISGFQSLKALSENECKPFDKNRNGLNLGEAAATIIYALKKEEDITDNDWIARRGAIRNDANHISGPSRTGEGSYRCLKYILKDENIEDIAFINAHGTSTLYNDEMEAIAIERAGLININVNSLKGYYGHTLGAAGVLETIISMQAIDNNKILATRGFNEIGVSRKIILSNENKTTNKKHFIKMLSGFGGCNAAILFSKGVKI
jgi:3-oxoacyl-[acyl-carrier-protein] synthase-1